MKSVVVLLTLLFTALAAAPHRDGVVIRNSGSTNSASYAIAVWSDGTTRTVLNARRPVPDAPVYGTIPAALAARLLADSKAAKAANPPPMHCMKSVSFGTTETLLYHDWQSPDLTCPSGSLIAQLRADAAAVVETLHLNVRPVRRLPMLPGARRAVPAATPTPNR